ncbi:MAG: hypothetical protein KF760_17920 [Candidatus Eremiobacteraeota bacterium]|nr:hypothetical protein [Candidatus Eremiobacteraeota bacterium]MCW5869259.1 hypothetical protein [Candidatus Eremiobacteraeota bacterium]
MNMLSGLPEAIPLAKLGELYDIPPGALAKVPDRLPKGFAFRIGRRWMVFVEKVRQHLEAGGSL